MSSKEYVLSMSTYDNGLMCMTVVLCYVIHEVKKKSVQRGSLNAGIISFKAVAVVDKA